MSDVTAWPAGRRITIRDLQAATGRGQRWSMLTSYDTLTAGIFEQAGVRALLVGDTSAEMVLGHSSTLPVTMDQLIPMVQAVVRGTRQILVWPDMAGLTGGRLPRFVKRYADTRGGLLDAAGRYAADVAARRYPDQAHGYA
jgi:ketopantoate hydroxymethyltransferase